MMQPKFEDFMEFVSKGERDPKLRMRLRAHPAADRLLAQARFIWRMVGLQVRGQANSGVDDFKRTVFGKKGLAPVPNVLFSKRRALVEDDHASFYATDSFGTGDRHKTGDLGTLVGLIHDDRVDLAHLPADPYADSPTVQAGLFAPGRRKSKSILIRDEALTITGPGTVDPGAALTLAIQHADSGQPVSGLEVVFMPESGPFARYSANDYGRLEFALPDQPGVLRMETDVPRFLAVRILNASNF